MSAGETGAAAAARGRATGWLAALAGLAALAAGGALAPRAQEVPGATWLLQHPGEIPALRASGALPASAVPDPHWREEGCTACHRGAPSAGNLRLRAARPSALCTGCHEPASAHSYIHPTDLVLPARMRTRLAQAFLDTLEPGSGRVGCATCHDVVAQCLDARRYERGLNPAFLRDGPYRTRTGLCYQCHDPDRHRRANAHDQLTDAGEVRPGACAACHAGGERPPAPGSASAHEFVVEGDLEALCTRCHERIVHPSAGFAFTPGGVPDHFVAPPAAMLERIRRMEAKFGVTLPLDPGNGRIYCATCHNPHERGVIRDAAAGKGADAPSRLRLETLCLGCHRK